MLGKQIKWERLSWKCSKRFDLNLKEFLSDMFNLITGLYITNKKPNSNLLYINRSSDHSPQIIKQLANSINKSFCENLVNEQVFNTIKQVHENDLHKSCYKSSPKYAEEIHQYNSKNRTQNIWFNPPFSQTVKTNIAKSFFRILDKYFPKSHSLYKIFNRNTIKISLWTMFHKS